MTIFCALPCMYFPHCECQDNRAWRVPTPDPRDAEIARLREALKRYADGSVDVADYVLANDVDGLIIEILGQRYGGGDAGRGIVAQKIVEGIRAMARARLATPTKETPDAL